MRRKLIVALTGLTVATGLAVAIGTDSGADLGSDGAVPAVSVPIPVVPAEYRKWITKSAKQCRQLSPQLMASQLHQESKLDPRAVSRTGARGIAQFMPLTWKSWGRDADGNGKSSPYEPADAIMAQGRLMCSLAKKAGKVKWRPGAIQLALAGYNAGWGAVTKHRGIPPYPETENYVVAVMYLAETGVPALGSPPPDKAPGKTPASEAPEKAAGKAPAKAS